MRSSHAVRRMWTVVVAMLLWVPVAAHAGTAPALLPAVSPVGNDIVVLREELIGLIESQRKGPAPFDDALVAKWQANLERAASQAEQAPCEAAEALLEFARAAREQVHKLGEIIAAGGWDREELAQLSATLSGLDSLSRRAATLRGRVFTEIPDADRCTGPLDVYVDTERARPKGESLPGFERGSTRPLASMSDSDGTPADFVADELIVSTSDKSALEAFLADWNGRVLDAVETKDGPTSYLVRIDTARAATEDLAEHLAGDLTALNPGKEKAESIAVSSQSGLALLAAAGAAARQAAGNDRFTIGVNWVAQPQGYGDGYMPEASSGPVGFSGTTYERNSYTWQYLREGGPQDIGVSAAWSVLDSAGKLGNKVDVALLDRGFDINDDHPGSTVLMSAVPFVDPSTNLAWESNWHGSHTLDTIAAIPGNGIGTAGTAGPVASPTGIWTTGDMFLIMGAINMALLTGNKVVNMSLGVAVPWYLSFTVLPFDAYTAFVRAYNDVLLIAGAGNDGKDVDATYSWPLSFEKAWHTPCENSGVICVGGLSMNTLKRHPDSNYGHEDVDIFAPYVVLGGPDPDDPNVNLAHKRSGTSFSSPYASGVAALIWAANPGQDADTVEEVLMNNMRWSSDTTIKRKVVNAFGAVKDALPAAVNITSPTDGSTLSPFIPTYFNSSLWADGHPLPATITWRRNGLYLASGPTFQAYIPAGTHTITATAVFADGTSTADVVTVNSIDHPPTVNITGPKATPPPTFDQSELIALHATGTDDSGSLPDSQLKWYLDSVGTTPFATGRNPTANTGGAIGAHTVILRACDSANQCAADAIPIVIQADGTNQPPAVHILNPTNGALLWVNGSEATGVYHEITLNATVSDPEGAPVAMEWFDNGVSIANTLTATVRLRGGCEYYGHQLELRATDNAGITRQDQVTVSVVMIC